MLTVTYFYVSLSSIWLYLGLHSTYLALNESFLNEKNVASDNVYII